MKWTKASLCCAQLRHIRRLSSGRSSDCLKLLVSFSVALDFSFKCFWHFTNLILIKEPVGSVSPKVNTADEFNVMRSEASKTLSILCPAQAYPTPVFRLVTFFLRLFFWTLSTSITCENHSNKNSPEIAFNFLKCFILISRNLFSEPISSTPPKLSMIDARPLLIPLNQSFALLCPAQGYPAPNFR